MGGKTAESQLWVYFRKGISGMKKLIVTIAIVVFVATSIAIFINRYEAMAETSKITYIPGKKCTICHAKMFRAYSKTVHAKSFENLADAGEATNPECLPCHTTGYGKPGGFKNAKSTSGLAGITCQSCHGPGSAHVEKGLTNEQRQMTIQRTPENVCIKCHTPHKAHPDIGDKSLPGLKRKLEGVQDRIDKLNGGR